MKKVVALVNHKGGVGKTTSAVNIAAGLAEEGKKVLLIDVDPQGSATEFLGQNGNGTALMHSLRNTEPLPVKSTVVDGLELVPSGPNLGEARQRFSLSVGSELLGRCLRETQGEWDWTVIDCPPSMDIFTLSALKISSMVMIPVEANHLGLHGLLQMKHALESYDSHLPRVDVAGIIPCRVHPRRRIHRNIMERLEELYPNKVAPTVRENVSLAEAPGRGRPVTVHARKSHGAHDYRNVTKWLLDKTGEVTVF